ncbi:18330_t:CDS:2, partial [Racocetra persica]
VSVWLYAIRRLLKSYSHQKTDITWNSEEFTILNAYRETIAKRFTFFGSPPTSPTLGSSFFASFPSQDNQDSKHPVLDDVRKAEINLERLVMAADAYRDLMDRLSKASKNFSKALKDYGNGKGLETT